MDQGIKSRPRYEPLHLDPAGRRHLVVTDQPALPDGAFAAPPVGAEIWTEAQLSNLTDRLAIETTGFRLYAVGTEPFIWDVAAVARAAGMVRGEFFLFHAGSLRRRVYCSHCKAMTDDVTTSIVRCAGCDAHLFVRDHFSARLAAFMGVQIDAEDHGAVPAGERLYP
jgi:hypothetical protein